ncbi:MAG TPA: cytochrome b/b6 domain-containing protein [Ramlibacter sp.]|uniref:cytochrome b/b6 domain-containing protein n=1 Tax=Ramlibacter sp. TaxID=1917967 RepID=UPI002D7F2900|nr:cytochrome b/b6 domain-containing protein [Ramlibacter sp.]HET8747133.1 cytochrome b/b6 domain-containing protein [Ramlibacter sp.]
MDTVPASPAENPRGTLVWDAPVRVFHWLLAASFAVAWLTSDGERWELVHVTAGYTMAGLVAFRILWGLVGTRHARFTQFVRGPRAALEYLGSLFGREPRHHTGHNPAGGLAIVALLGLTALTALSGWAYYEQIAGHWMKEVHETLAGTMLALVVLHVAAVVASSLLHRENLVAAMVHGRKPAPGAEGIRSPWRSVALVLLAGVLGFWWLQWQAAPAAEQAALLSGHHHHHDHDDDHDED